MDILNECEYQLARNYWKVLKTRLKSEGNETVTNCNQLKLTAADGKKYMTDVANTEGILCIINQLHFLKRILEMMLLLFWQLLINAT